MIKAQKLQNKISKLEIKIMSIKINANTYYSTIPYDKLQKLQDERIILKKQKKNLLRLQKLEKLSK